MAQDLEAGRAARRQSRQRWLLLLLVVAVSYALTRMWNGASARTAQ